MDIISAFCTDVGTKKVTNQDSVLLKSARSTQCGNVLLAAVFDGMGGLQKGELASAQLVFRFGTWFSKELPPILRNGLTAEAVNSSINRLLIFVNQEIGQYGKANGFSLGSTATVMLIVDEQYFIAHVGDSRVYEIGSSITQLTKDQTVVQYELDRGIITPSQAKNHPRRNVLLQCVGASKLLEPAFVSGTLKRNCVYMLCSDGFRHEITPEEIRATLAPAVMTNEEAMKRQAESLIELCKERGEKDNITAVTLRTL